MFGRPNDAHANNYAEGYVMIRVRFLSALAVAKALALLSILLLMSPVWAGDVENRHSELVRTDDGVWGAKVFVGARDSLHRWSPSRATCVLSEHVCPRCTGKR